MTDRERAFQAMKRDTDPSFEDTTIYGYPVRLMTPDERTIALGWALTRVKRLEGML